MIQPTERPVYCAYCETHGADEATATIQPGDKVRNHVSGTLWHDRCVNERRDTIVNVINHPQNPGRVRREYRAKLAQLADIFGAPFVYGGAE